jgi:hypothetical protein
MFKGATVFGDHPPVCERHFVNKPETNDWHDFNAFVMKIHIPDFPILGRHMYDVLSDEYQVVTSQTSSSGTDTTCDGKKYCKLDADSKTRPSTPHEFGERS